MKKYILIVDCPSIDAGRLSISVHITLKFSAPNVYGTKMPLFSHDHIRGKLCIL